jgi:hypothetical protein
MQRKEWKFSYSAPQLAEAARAKIDYHAEHLGFWMKKREELMATIREEGIEINEKIALGYVNPKARDWDRGGEIMIRNDLRKGLVETFEKLSYHTGKRDTYDGWEQVLRAKPDNTLDLDIEDWLFFFGRDTERDDD